MRRPSPSIATGQLQQLQQSNNQRQPIALCKKFFQKRWIFLFAGLAFAWTFRLLRKQTTVTTTANTVLLLSKEQQQTADFLQVAAAAISAAAVASESTTKTTTITDPSFLPPLITSQQQRSPPSNTSTTTISSSKCFSWNSPEWLQGPRLSNAHNSMPLSWIHDNFQTPILRHLLLTSASSSSLNDIRGNYNKTNILDQTICHPRGRFRLIDTSPPVLESPAMMDEWEFRLLYLAIHRLHHQAALAEYQLRLQHDCFSDVHQPKTTSNSNNKNNGPLQQTPHNYEYECQNAKYLVTALPTLGMGAALRLGAVPAIFMALTTGRVPLFIMHATTPTTRGRKKKKTNTPPRPDFVTQPWPLASCANHKINNSSSSSSFHHTRHDLQCVFLPTSPCVLTQHMLDQAVLVPEIQARNWRRSGMVDSKLQQIPVLLVEARTSPAKFDEFRIQHTLRRQAFELVKELIEEWDMHDNHHDNNNNNNDHHAAAAAAASTDTNQSAARYFPYGHREFKLAHAVLLYVIRPNHPAAQRIQREVQRAFLPTTLNSSFIATAAAVGTNNANTSNSSTNTISMQPDIQAEERDTLWIGLPIRGSDKCQAESTCLAFSQYMELSMQKWREQQNHSKSLSSGRGNIILTSEDEDVLSQRVSYQKQQDPNNDFPLNFVVNENDVAQGTGLPKRYRDRADDIMISSLVALQMQLHATTSVGNCCSNFYLMLLDLLRNGCGRHDHSYHMPVITTTSKESKPPPAGSTITTTLECLQEMADPQFHVCCGWTRTDECDGVRRRFGENRERLRLARATTIAETTANTSA